ncbi:RIO1-domain-containing protein [Laetiporus sulphureus 93-53]|uniref:Serine/threonine-protein kinase RIO2 n=1 Tax=Laetiporus sulphureus 93-53 TaxID=1314785 RepID=A0A165DZ68_9APHY|nr:RIO1-domain-containing protein [Laetiporus sulphureus 93-53]KZT05936.1 RIO1-domain-containing protein [Laetiporus sulphureus 93-53]
MRLDATDLRYITSEEFRVLTAVEMGSKNHEIVPTALIAQISGLRNGGVNKNLGVLAKRSLVARMQNARYDGYRLTYGGYDFLAMRALSKRDSMASVGNQIGVGKESDIYIVADAEGQEMVLKLHRLGRISFRAIKEKRDYMGKRKSASWMYMSRLAAEKEWAFMKVLHEHGFPVPTPIDHARHCILMEFIDAYPLRQVADIPSPGKLYSELMDIIVRFARVGLIHGDFNEFNILIRRDTGDPVVIDFPQMVSTSHMNAEMYFNRDVECIRKFFRKRFRYESKLYPRFSSMRNDEDGEGFQLDVIVAASGFKNQDQRMLEEYMSNVAGSEGGGNGDDGGAYRDNREGGSSNEEEEEEEEMDEDDDDKGEDGDEDDKGRKGKDEDEEEEEEEEEGKNKKEEVKNGKRKRTREEYEPEEIHRGRRQSRSPSLTPGPSSPNERRGGGEARLSPPRNVSRSPPASRHVSRSPDSSALLAERMAEISIGGSQHDDESSDEGSSHEGGSSRRRDVPQLARTQAAKQRARQKRKHGSKTGTGAGRPKGSKAKMDTRVKLDDSGFWG